MTHPLRKMIAMNLLIPTIGAAAIGKQLRGVARC